MLTTCPRLFRRVARVGFEPATHWSQVQRSTHCATAHYCVLSAIYFQSLSHCLILNCFILKCTRILLVRCKVFGRPFAKRFALCYWTVVLAVLYVCDVLYCGQTAKRPNGWMYQDATWYGGRPRPRRHCVRRGPSFPYEKGHSSPPPTFQPMSIVAKRSLISAPA